MASIIRYGDKWRAHLYVGGHRESQLFNVQAEATRWAIRREKELQVDRTAGFFGQTYELLPVEFLRNLRPVTANCRFSGVYFLWGFADELVYIGQSKDISRRIVSHTKKPPVRFSRATYLRVEHPWQLAIERLYIDAYIGEVLTEGSGVVLANCG